MTNFMLILAAQLVQAFWQNKTEKSPPKSFDTNKFLRAFQS